MTIILSCKIAQTKKRPMSELEGEVKGHKIAIIMLT